MMKCKVYRCARCSTRLRLQLHHKTYERLGCELASDFDWLCSPCHRKTHREWNELVRKEKAPKPKKKSRWLKNNGKNYRKGGKKRRIVTVKEIPQTAVKKRKCPHPETEERLVTFKNGDQHIQLNCSLCGKFVGYIKKSESALTGFRNPEYIYDDEQEFGELQPVPRVFKRRKQAALPFRG